MGYGTRLWTLAAALSIFSAGCATAEWTEDLFAKRQVEVDARFVKVETGVREQGGRIDRVEVRVANLDTRLTETRDLVRTALPQAPSTVTARPNPSEARPSQVTPERTVRGGRTLIGVVHVPFGFDRADLEPGAEAALAAIVTELHEHPNMTIDLEGTTDRVGRLDYNLRLSQRSVEAVTRSGTSNAVDRSRVVGAKRRGPHALKDDVNWRVMVKFMTSAE
jgi:outer membrane protein OmpA-like peptidoglycan-associated protein